MNAAGVLAWRIAGGQATVRELCSQVGEDHWGYRPAPGQNVLGFSLWHSATIVDWTVNAFIRGKPEVRTGPEWAGTSLAEVTTPFGMSLHDADRLAAGVTPAVLADYTRAVCDDVLPWVESRDERTLDEVPTTRANLDAYPAEKTELFMKELGWMLDGRTWELLGRPCMGHVFVHTGEVFLGLELARAAAG